MGAERQRRLPLAGEVGPEVPRLVTLGLEAELGKELAEELAGRSPLRSPAEPPGTLRSAGARVELAQIGDHPRRVDRRGLGGAHPIRSRRSACARQ
jgi:hypothetical protein